MLSSPLRRTSSRAPNTLAATAAIAALLALTLPRKAVGTDVAHGSFHRIGLSAPLPRLAAPFTSASTYPTGALAASASSCRTPHATSPTRATLAPMAIGIIGKTLAAGPLRARLALTGGARQRADIRVV